MCELPLFTKQCGCELCLELSKDELVLRRFPNFSIIFNRYPYVPGHIMILSNFHILNNFNALTDVQKIELMDILVWAQNTLIKATGYNSLNIGMNIGPHSGGSIPEHFHLHIIPRSQNDVNFMTLTTNQPVSVSPHFQYYNFYKHIYDIFQIS